MSCYSISFFENECLIFTASWLKSAQLTLDTFSDLLIDSESRFQNHALSFEWKGEDGYYSSIEDDEDLRSAVQKQTKSGSSSLRFFVTATRKRARTDNREQRTCTAPANENERRTKPLAKLSVEQVVSVFERLELHADCITAVREHGINGRVLSTAESESDLRARGLTEETKLTRVHAKMLIQALQEMKEKGVSVNDLPPDEDPEEEEEAPPDELSPSSKPIPAPDNVVLHLQSILESVQAQIKAQDTTNKEMFNRILAMQERTEARVEVQMKNFLREMQGMQNKMETRIAPNEETSTKLPSSEQKQTSTAANEEKMTKLMEDLHNSQRQMESRVKEQMANVLRGIQGMKEKIEARAHPNEERMTKLMEELQETQKQIRTRVDEHMTKVLQGMEGMKKKVGARGVSNKEGKAKPEGKKQKDAEKGESRAPKTINIEIEDAESARMRREHEEKVNEKLSVVRRCCAEAEARKVSPLYYACEEGDVEGVQALLDSEEYMESIALENESIALQDYMKVPIIERLNRPEKSKNEETPLHAAAKNGHTDLASFLIACNADTAVKDRSLEFTPMHFAANDGHTETVSVLIDQDANMNEIDKDGRTPLHIAAMCGLSRIVSVLIKAKANVGAKDKKGKTALDYACNNEEIRNLLSRST